MDLSLTPHQEERADALLARLRAGGRVAVLTGAAGTGKTRLLAAVCAVEAANGRGVRRLAPTGKAASRLRQVTGDAVDTIHGAHYGSVEKGKAAGSLRFGRPRAVCEEGDLVAIDEGSMVDQALWRSVVRTLPPGASIIVAADPHQLPPVNGPCGPDLARPDAELLEVHRQALEEPSLRLATALRAAGDRWEWRRLFREAGVAERDPRCTLNGRARREDAVAWWEAHRAAGRSVVGLTYTNAARWDLNGRQRRARGIRGEAFQAGDTVLCLRNQRDVGWFNGEVRPVFEAVRAPGAPWPCAGILEGPEDDEPVWARADFAGRKVEDWEWTQFSEELKAAARAAGQDEGELLRRWVLADLGDWLTYHKSQGSEWDAAGLWLDGFTYRTLGAEGDTLRRLCYTGLTRSRGHAAVWEGR